MALKLPETQAVADTARHLANYLPGRPHPRADQAASFPGVAAKLGLQASWPGGSKTPALTCLLERTLEHQRSAFCRLVVEIVREGIKYRTKNGDPITRDEIDTLNRLILRLSFRIPELWNEEFLAGLPVQNAPQTSEPPDGCEQSAGPSPGQLAELCSALVGLQALTPQERGYAFERLLRDVFEAFGLSPRSPFRLTGEQIDGSFEFGDNTYLVEARWESKQTDQSALLTFQGKVEGKASWARGLFVSYAGFSMVGLEAFARGRRPSIIAMSSEDLFQILSGVLDLRGAIARKSRRAAETGEIMVRVQDLVET